MSTHSASTILDAITATAKSKPIRMDQDDINGYSFQNVWDNGTGTAVTTVEASNDPYLNGNIQTDSSFDVENADWTDITSLLTITNGAGSAAGTDMIIINNTRFGWIRFINTITGTLTMSTHACSHGEG